MPQYPLAQVDAVPLHDPAEADLRLLHKTMEDGWGYPMRLGRPPRWEDDMKGGFTSYDVFALMGYQYLSAGFDGACRLPGKSYQAEVEAAEGRISQIIQQNNLRGRDFRQLKHQLKQK